MAKIIGDYHITKPSELKGQNLTLVIGTRANPTPSKPPRYLLERTENKQFNYISSLYPVPHPGGLECYSLEKGGNTYILTINRAECRAEVKQHSITMAVCCKSATG